MKTLIFRVSWSRVIYGNIVPTINYGSIWGSPIRVAKALMYFKFYFTTISITQKVHKYVYILASCLIILCFDFVDV